MSSTFKTGLDGKVNENDKDLTKNGFFNQNSFKKKKNDLKKESEYFEVYAENKSKPKNPDQKKKNNEKKNLNFYCLNDN